jgi:hypothetical protein
MRKVTFLLVANCFAIAGCTSESTEIEARRATKPIARTFDGAGIKKLVLRTVDADSFQVTVDNTRDTIEIRAIPVGGAEGYHSADPSWKETPPDEWGLDFVCAKHGDVLVISAKGEMCYIHHCYYLAGLTLRVPDGISVVRENRKLTGGTGTLQPDLAAPAQ